MDLDPTRLGSARSQVKDAVAVDSGRGRGERRRHMQLHEDGPDEPADDAEGLRGEAVRQRVHQSGHFHLRRLPVETIHGGGQR